jgi:hypothetical protein
VIHSFVVIHPRATRLDATRGDSRTDRVSRRFLARCREAVTRDDERVASSSVEFEILKIRA